MIVEVMFALLVVFCVFLVALKKERTHLLFLLLIPLLAVLDNVYFKLIPNVFVSFCFYVAAFSIAFFPLLFLSSYFKKDLSLLILVSLLIEWDWLMTWYYVFQNSAAELNSLLNVSNFFIFSLQKLSPLVLLIILYYLAKSEENLIRVLDGALVVVAVSYYLLFLWHLHVTSVVSISLHYIMVLSMVTGAFSASRLIKLYLIDKKLIK